MAWSLEPGIRDGFRHLSPQGIRLARENPVDLRFSLGGGYQGRLDAAVVTIEDGAAIAVDAQDPASLAAFFKATGPIDDLVITITIRGHRTSVSLELEFWQALKRLAATQGRGVAAIVAEIDAARGKDVRIGLSSAIRLYVLRTLQET